MTEPAPIGRFSSHGEFLAVLRAQAERMGLNYQMLDAAAGFGDGYSTKVLPDRPQKNFSPRSFDAYLGALGLEFIAVENPQKVARTKAFCKAKELRPDGPRVVRAIARMPRPTWLFSSKRARIAAKKRWRTTSPKARRKAARKAAKARWGKHRLAALKCPKLMEQVQLPPGGAHGDY